ncbi:hypothetical protein BCU70_09865 [Vibrio sp. 10N.286.49.C2]|uniref:hypothetical protein n=1 Tax=Vibrio sp. 10N.286.49.C2 TaxID=1880856 RepID=UPI000C83D65A|nr:MULTISPECIES: hypothetical protein [unclassified Vibrio]PMH26446.1 hypothetical protein BCU70_09865 [Vibrio sp. 10N.286.49.C2]PMH54830.1 hypothetical protein BCU66_11070 [Vibrio sp. 10N.286.49.B1]PMH82086.1 hypothetical protein BCU58_19305 [Vibrio sp. 10N.286.48.B7]
MSGLVGVAGISVVLNDSQNLFEWRKVVMVLASYFFVVVIAEALVSKSHSRNPHFGESDR